MTTKEIITLVQKDFDEFQLEFGRRKLQEVIKRGKLPIRKETMNLIGDTPLMRDMIYTKFKG